MKVKVIDMDKTKLNKLLIYTFLIFFVSMQTVLASSEFTLGVATEDFNRSTPGNPYYITSTIKVTSYTVDATSINYGPVEKTVTVTDPSDDYWAFTFFWPIPTDSIVMFENSAEGYTYDYDEVYVSSALSNAYESLEQHFSHSENGFITTCTMSVEKDFPYYQCSVVDEYETSAKFIYLRPEDPATGEIYDLVYVTNKLVPEEEPIEPPIEPPVEPPIVCTDEDGDGYSPEGGYCGPIDCNDNDPNIYPGAPEVCNGKDNSCNGLVDGIEDSGDVCRLLPGEAIDVSLSPNTPFDRNDIVCSVDVDNIYDPLNIHGLTIHYFIETTTGFNVLGDFNCPGGQCSQDIIINNQFTDANSELSCKAWFSYNSYTYERNASVYIHPNPNDEETSKEERYDLNFDRMRFVDGNVAKPGDTLEFQVSLNNYGKSFSNMKVNLVLLGLDNDERYSLGPFDLREHKTEFGRFVINIPEDTSPGEYYARISITDGEYRMVRHRVFSVEN